MTSQGAMHAGNSGLSIVKAGKQSNIATVVVEFAAILCHLFEAVQANEVPSSFQNSCMHWSSEVWQP